MRYATATAFRQALEQRIKMLTGGDSLAIQRLRKWVTFERFLSRLQAHADSPWFLKGAFALQLRLKDRARTTRDLDLGIHQTPGRVMPVTKVQVAALLREAAARSLDDFFEFAIGEGEDTLPDQEIRAYRFIVQALLAERIFEVFVLDVGTMIPLVTPPDEIDGSGILDFSGISPRRFRVVSLAQQIAEKMHAFTFPWKDRENTRVKDLLDLVLILEVSPPDPTTTRSALQAVFGGRSTHPLPLTLPHPPDSWADPYAIGAKEMGLTHTTIEDANLFLAHYWTKLFS